MRHVCIRHLVLAVCLTALVASPRGRLAAQGEAIEVRGTGTAIGIYRDELTDAIQESIKKGCLWLRNNQARDGSWNPPDGYDSSRHEGPGKTWITPGATGVILMGLLYSGVNTDSPTIQRGLAYMAAQEHNNDLVYTRAAILSAAAMSDPLRRDRRVMALVDRQMQWILRAQQEHTRNLWDYHFRKVGRYDYSIVQFVAESMRIANNYGYQIPPGSLVAIRDAIIRDQDRGGGWAYNPGVDKDHGKDRTGITPDLTMTAATIGSLASLDAILAPRENRLRRDPNIERGLKALDTMVSERSLDRLAREHYEIYSLERAGILTGTRYIGGVDWYREIARRVVARQKADGSFPDYNFHGNRRVPALGTGMMLLFLGKGLAPTVVGRLDWGPPSTSTAYDMHYLTEAVTRNVGMHLNWISMPIDASVDEYMKVPVIYITGDEDPYPALVRHKEKFIKYLNDGGTILATGTENNKEFEDGYTRFVKEIQPGAELEELPLDHGIYSRRFNIRRPYGLFATRSAQGGRPMAMLIKQPFALPLSTQRHRNTPHATQLGVNAIVYLTQIDSRPNFLEDVMK